MPLNLLSRTPGPGSGHQEPMRIYRMDNRHPETQERRAEPRYPAVDNASEVGWVENGTLRSTAAQLMDVSRDGALVIGDEEPGAGSPVLLRLVEPNPTLWVETTLVESRRTRLGPFQLRLVFRGVPPPEFLERASAT